MRSGMSRSYISHKEDVSHIVDEGLNTSPSIDVGTYVTL